MPEIPGENTGPLRGLKEDMFADSSYGYMYVPCFPCTIGFLSGLQQYQLVRVFAIVDCSSCCDCCMYCAFKCPLVPPPVCW